MMASTLWRMRLLRASSANSLTPECVPGYVWHTRFNTKECVMTLVDLVRISAQRYADNPALTMRRGYRTYTLTYQELYIMAKRIALFLADHGIEPGQNVILLASNSPLWVAIFFGVQLRGCRIVPLTVQSTAEFVKKTIEQTHARIVFKHLFFKEVLPDGVQIVDVDFIDELVAGYDHAAYQPIAIDEDSIAQILYTSGTTGDPKGTQLTHRNLMSNTIAVAGIIQVQSGKDRALSILPLSHILEQTAGMLLPLYTGVEVVYAHSPAVIAPLMHQHRITKMIAVPEFLNIVRSRVLAQINGNQMAHWWFNTTRMLAEKISSMRIRRILFWPVLRNFGCIDTFASGGAPLSAELERWWNSLGIHILQGYGLTETSPIVTLNSYDVHRFASVGRVLSGVHVRLTPDHEILVKGPNVFAGYYNNEQKTREAFTDDGWFKTGDIGEFDADGFLFLRGRKKYMILGPGGQNVFPEDIEDAINKVPGVKDSTVLGIELPNGAVQIHAVLLLADAGAKPENIIAQANASLSSYQHITAYSVWGEDDFPRSATRKVKKEVVRAALKIQAHTQHAADVSTTPLMRIISHVCNVAMHDITEASVLVRDLQLDSLKRVELVARIEQEFLVVIDEAAIGPTTTVQQLQEMMSSKKPVKSVAPLARWPRWLIIRIIGFIVQEVFLLLSRLFMRVEITGLEHLNNSKGPVLYMVNHLSNWDAAVVARVLPWRVRFWLSFAAAQDVVYEEYRYVSWLIDLVFNSFPLPRQVDGAIKVGLENTGAMLDQGFSVVVFPEGKISTDVQLLPFKEGAGLMATHMNVPVVCIRIRAIEKIFPHYALIPRRFGTVYVSIAAPVKFLRSQAYGQATQQLEQIVQHL